MTVQNGGGGGSSYGGAGPSDGITISTASSTQAPSATITYTAPSASALAQTLVDDSKAKAPGTALLDKATAIQTAVNAVPQQTATACAGITNYLGLVKAQTGKKLTTGTAAQPTTDAQALAATLGC